jgi:hypothetical protein
MDRLHQDGWREQPVLRALRVIIPVLLVALVLVRLGGIVSDYREARSGGDKGASAETTETVEPSTEETGSAGGEGTAEPTEPEETGESPGSAEDEQAQAHVVVTIDGLNFRDGPDTGSAVIDTLAQGTRLAVIDSENGWYKVRTEDGTVGWVSSSPQFVSVEER